MDHHQSERKKVVAVDVYQVFLDTTTAGAVLTCVAQSLLLLIYIFAISQNIHTWLGIAIDANSNLLYPTYLISAGMYATVR
jgi:hypothetical protein